MGVILVNLKLIDHRIVIARRKTGCDAGRNPGDARHYGKRGRIILAMSGFQFKDKIIRGLFPRRKRIGIQLIGEICPQIIPKRDGFLKIALLSFRQ